MEPKHATMSAGRGERNTFSNRKTTVNQNTYSQQSYPGCVYMDCRECSVDLPIADALNACCKALRTIYEYKKV